MRIEGKVLHHWLTNFYGYGSWTAPFWFIAHEEGGGETPEEVGERFHYFYEAHPNTLSSLVNIREMYRNVSFRGEGPRAKLFTTLYDYRFGPGATQHGIWKNLVAFTHGYKGLSPGDLLDYQRNQFATTHEALIRLYPLPGPLSHAWYYSWLDLPEYGFLKSRALYEEHVFPQRIATILKNIKVHKPGVVLMYGMNRINAIKQSVQNTFPGTSFKTVKAIPQQIPQYHWADLQGTNLLITTQIPALRHNRVETGFDWERLGGEISSIIS